ncbi:hypothetical protein J1N35_008026 [Gossypium stocksii]|uniref:Uncharacterized protein n=1 Tax=Gossypium stocksii TaxID=47602 RepID=A0A9D3W9M0_9ROSI|nr:hypothetical protein J1N35_008026 [Gossypium stocksii]
MASLPPSNGQTEDKESPSKSSLTQDNSSPLVVFAHGAGAPSSFDWMIRPLLSPSSFIRLYDMSAKKKVSFQDGLDHFNPYTSSSVI